MDETTAAARSAPSSRIDENDPPWPARGAIMAGLCALAGAVFYPLADADGLEAPAALVATATISFVLTVERRRALWAILFALLWGAVIALIVQGNRGYNVNPSPFEWPFWSALLAVVVAAPLFQTWRDVAASPAAWRWDRLPYDRLHLHAWTDAVIGVAAGVFVGISVALAYLIAGLFALIGIDILKDLLDDGWFAFLLMGAAFGAAVGLLRERDRLVGTLQRLVMVVLAVLAPVLAAALALFLLSLVATGFGKLWASGFSTAALMLGAAAFAVLLTNAVIGNGRADRAVGRVMQWAAPVLAVAVLPLAAIALSAMLLRIGQYGWTPERLWGMVAVLVALGYGAAGLWAVVRGRGDFDDVLRPLQQKLAIGLMLLATLLALPLIDFGAISTRDQLARLTSGQVKPERFDWAAMAFDFGPAGRAALTALTQSPKADIADSARIALAAKSRWELVDGRDQVPLRPIEKMVRVLPQGAVLDDAMLAALDRDSPCRRHVCIVQRVGDSRMAVIGRYRADGPLEASWFERAPGGGEWRRLFAGPGGGDQGRTDAIDLNRAEIRIRPVTRQQVEVNGIPVGEPVAP